MQSSVIRHVNYDPGCRELLIVFVSGRRYVYIGVPAKIAAQFKAAESRGTYFNARIRDHFPYREIESVRR